MSRQLLAKKARNLEWNQAKENFWKIQSKKAQGATETWTQAKVDNGQLNDGKSEAKKQA